MKHFYSVIWRWHFFCGIIFIPFIILLSLTGAIYLFNDEYDNFAYDDLLDIESVATGKVLSASEQLTIVRSAYPDRMTSMYITGENENRSTEVVLKKHRQFNAPINASINAPTTSLSATSGWSSRNEISPEKLSVFINPYTGEILGELDSSKRFMNIVKDLHGELLAGKYGTKLVELSASWAIVLMITGLFMWWPRSKSLRGTLIPRLKSGKRTFWRDLHAVPAFYFSFFIIFILMTGLPWTDVWGTGFKYLKSAAGQSAPASFFDFKVRSQYQEGKTSIDLDHVLQIAQEKNLHGQLKIRLPMGKNGAYNLIRDAGDPVDRVVLQVDQYSGELINEVRWNDNPPVEKAVSLGIKLHRGEYFGVPNQILGLLTALSLVFMSATAVIMWWRRRPEGTLGAPPKIESATYPRWLLPVTLSLAVFLPLLGLSLVIFGIIDFLVRKLSPKARGVIWNS